MGGTNSDMSPNVLVPTARQSLRTPPHCMIQLSPPPKKNNHTCTRSSTVVENSRSVRCLACMVASSVSVWVRLWRTSLG